MTEEDKLRAARKLISEFRASEGTFAVARSRSTASRNRYKAGFETLAKVEAVLNGSHEEHRAATE
jgi:hypothetical protein